MAKYRIKLPEIEVGVRIVNVPEMCPRLIPTLDVLGSRRG